MIESIADLKPDPDNPRRIKDKAANGLKASMDKYGDLSGITFNKRTKELVCGHQRVQQLEALGGVWREGAIYLPAKDEPFPVRIVDWTKTKQREANWLANNQFIAGEFYGDLKDQLLEIKTSMGDDNFEEMNLDKLAKALKVDLEPETDEVGDAPVPANPVTKPGDVWTLGDHTLVCGDATDAACYPPESNLLLTDPPYGVDYGEKNKALNESDGGRRLVNGIANDTAAPLPDLLRGVFDNAKTSLVPGGAYYIFHPPGPEALAYYQALKDSSLRLRQVLAWVKNGMVLGRSDYHGRHEPCLYGWKEGAAHTWEGDRSQTTVLEFERPMASKEHPTMKPIALFAYLIRNSSKKGQMVLDPFCGSGTTILAAEQTQRKGWGIELEPGYCDVIIQRWEEMSGRTATRG